VEIEISFGVPVARTAKRTNGFFFFRTLDIQRPANIEILLKPKWKK